MLAWVSVVYYRHLKYNSVEYRCNMLAVILVRRFPDDKSTNHSYYAFVHSHLLYTLKIYVNICPSYLDKLMKLSNKLLRILQNKPLRFRVSELYANFKTLPATLFHKQHLLMFIYRVLECPYRLPHVCTEIILIST